jgi:hypothetical protein
MELKLNSSLCLFHKLQLAKFYDVKMPIYSAPVSASANRTTAWTNRGRDWDLSQMPPYSLYTGLLLTRALWHNIGNRVPFWMYCSETSNSLLLLLVG